MTDKEFRKLNRKELVDIIYYIQTNSEALQAENEELKKELELKKEEQARREEQVRLEEQARLAQEEVKLEEVVDDTEDDFEDWDDWGDWEDNLEVAEAEDLDYVKEYEQYADLVSKVLYGVLALIGVSILKLLFGKNDK